MNTIENYLILQVLGTNDIKIDNQAEGLYKSIKGNKRQNIEKNLARLQNRIKAKPQIIQFPLIESLIKKFKHEDFTASKRKLIFGVILSNQKTWIEGQQEGIDDELLWDFVAKDGIWAENLLRNWFENKKIEFADSENFELEYHLFPFEIEAAWTYGVADWEAIERETIAFWQDRIEENSSNYYFKADKDSTDRLVIDKFIVQHNSGAPSLKNALYLWGIEKKIARYPIEFIYLSEENSFFHSRETEDNLVTDKYALTKTHHGEHWQWHLQLPLIRSLLEIKDFSGALQLVKNAPNLDYIDRDIVRKLESLDRAVSFNLIGAKLPNGEARDGRSDVIERVAIALWTEESYRQRGHWVHWYLRMAGAFELTLFLLVEQQRKLYLAQNPQLEKEEKDLLNIYQWQYPADFPTLAIANEPVNKKNHPVEVNRLGVDACINQLLKNGKANNQGRDFRVSPITDNRWHNFGIFYCDPAPKDQRANKSGHGWIPKIQESDGNIKSDKNTKKEYFSTFRNKLYHSLGGDCIDKILDEKLKQSQSSSEEHPSKVALKWLEYLIELGANGDRDRGFKSDIYGFKNRYQTRYENLLKQLF